MTVKIAFGIDEDTEVAKKLREYIVEQNHKLVFEIINEPWPEVGYQVGLQVARLVADIGIAICYTGTGVTIAANKVPGIRASLCKDRETAEGARRWNDANVLTIASKDLKLDVAIDILKGFLSTEKDPNEQRYIDMINIYEQGLRG